VRASRSVLREAGGATPPAYSTLRIAAFVCNGKDECNGRTLSQCNPYVERSVPSEKESPLQKPTIRQAVTKLATWRTLALCDKPFSPEEYKTDGHGKAGHDHCHIDQVCTLQMPHQLTPIIRCPYCQVGNEFLMMLERVEGWFQCDICGHNAMPLDPEFRCSCSKCAASRSPRFPALW